jgi:hypothetical protein
MPLGELEASARQVERDQKISMIDVAHLFYLTIFAVDFEIEMISA